MAKITIVADTELATIECDVNGKKLDNLRSCEIYKTSMYDYEEGKEKTLCRFYANMDPKKEDGVTIHMSAQASKNPEAKDAIEKGKAEFLADDVVIIQNNSIVSNDIAKALNVKL